MFRSDSLKNDPAQIKHHLSEYGNRVLDDLWLSKGCPKNIKIMKQDLDCKGELRMSRFGAPSSKGYDGVHMRGKLATQHYTRSVIDILLDVMPNVLQTPPGMPGPKLYAKAVKNGPYHIMVNLTQAQP